MFTEHILCALLIYMFSKYSGFFFFFSCGEVLRKFSFSSPLPEMCNSDDLAYVALNWKVSTMLLIVD